MVVPKKNIIGRRLRDSRLKKKFSQDQLSAKLARQSIQIDRAGISKIETGDRCVRDYEVKAIAKVLGISPSQLLGD